MTCFKRIIQKDMDYNNEYDEEYNELKKAMDPVLARDQMYTKAVIAIGKKVWNENCSDKDFKVSKYEISSQDGTLIEVQVTEKQDAQKNAPCLVYYHGGGWLLPVMTAHLQLIKEYVSRTDCKVVCVDYRLIPEFAFPKALEDCYSALLWAHDNAKDLGINPENIVVGGDSAGAHFAAVISLVARDKKGPSIAGQMMMYPATDATMSSESMKNCIDTPMWNGPMTAVVYGQYLANGDFGMRSYVSPIEADHTNLPKAYIEVTHVDPLRDEGIAYANALEKAGVDVELVRTKRTIHGFDYLAVPNDTIKQSFEKRANFLNSIWK